MLQAERCRADTAQAALVKRLLTRMIKTLEASLTQMEAETAAHIAADPRAGCHRRADAGCRAHHAG